MTGRPRGTHRAAPHGNQDLQRRKLLDPCLARARAWVLDMTGLVRVDLTCAHALLRAVTRLHQTTAVQVRGARCNMRRILRHAGFDVLTSIEY
ncbi:STAS domain-containing protein [Streptomyces murinus]|uniref:STAS domain-containing protein n=1 Tax=Streptomyces murinus TaxID=33900 RepID=UPI0038114FA7